MIDEKHVVNVSPFDTDDQKSAERLGIILPELWSSERLDERLSRKNYQLEIDPDNLISALDELEIHNAERFGLLIDSLRHDQGARAVTEYAEAVKYKYAHIHEESDKKKVPFATVLIDSTPTVEEGSDREASVGLLLGSYVMNALLDYHQEKAIKHTKDEKARHLRFGGLVTQVSILGGNIIARIAGAYEGVPIMDNPLASSLTGSVASTVTGVLANIMSKKVKDEDICHFIEGNVRDHMVDIAEKFPIVSYRQTFGDALPRSVIKQTIADARAEVDSL